MKTQGFVAHAQNNKGNTMRDIDGNTNRVLENGVLMDANDYQAQAGEGWGGHETVPQSPARANRLLWEQIEAAATVAEADYLKGGEYQIAAQLCSIKKEAAQRLDVAIAAIMGSLDKAPDESNPVMAGLLALEVTEAQVKDAKRFLKEVKEAKEAKEAKKPKAVRPRCKPASTPARQELVDIISAAGGSIHIDELEEMLRRRASSMARDGELFLNRKGMYLL